MFNQYIVVPFVVWAIAQFLKFSLAALAGRVDYKYLYASGGMPSVHAAVVMSLATTAYLIDGPQSSIFGLTVILAGIVMYDSFGVRRSSGEQAIAINHILENMEQRGALKIKQRHLREILGHKPMEVTVGAILGVALGMLFNIDRIGPLLAWLSRPLPKWGLVALAVVGLTLIVGSLISRVIILRKMSIIPQMRQAVKQSFVLCQAFGWLTLILAALHYEKVAVAAWRVWPVLIALTFIPWFGRLVWRHSREMPQLIAQHRTEVDKQKWFEGPNKKRRREKERAKKRK